MVKFTKQLCMIKLKTTQKVPLILFIIILLMHCWVVSLNNQYSFFPAQLFVQVVITRGLTSFVHDTSCLRSLPISVEQDKRFHNAVCNRHPKKLRIVQIFLFISYIKLVHFLFFSLVLLSSFLTERIFSSIKILCQTSGIFCGTGQQELSTLGNDESYDSTITSADHNFMTTHT